MPSLTIGSRTAKLPIVQGGMAIRISMAPLATAVANAGGVGVIAGSGLTPRQMAEEMRMARSATDGVLGVNVMVAVRQFKEVVQAAISEGVDIIIAGAGFSRDVFGWCKEAGVEMVPIVGSARVAKLAEKFGASAVVVEGFEAGGHLGTDQLMEDLLPEILDAVSIPVIGAGGVVTGADIKRVLDLGAAGVQMGSRFAATVESSASDEFKQLYVDATPDDIIEVRSPVGLPGRAIKTPFIESIMAGERFEESACWQCLKVCDNVYCISDRLKKSQQGDVEHGLVFAGSSAARVHDIPTVDALIERLVSEYQAAEAGEAS